MASDIEYLPGDWMITYRQLGKWRKGETFEIFDSDSNKHTVDPSDPSIDEFRYYYQQWDMYHHFGFPHGGGWADYPPWYPDFLKFFDAVFEDIKRYRQQRAQRNT